MPCNGNHMRYTTDDDYNHLVGSALLFFLSRKIARLGVVTLELCARMANKILPTTMTGLFLDEGDF